jgi:hypothetical protein
VHTVLRTDTVQIPIIDGEVVEPATPTQRRYPAVLGVVAFLLLVAVVAYGGYVAADLTGLSR